MSIFNRKRLDKEGSENVGASEGTSTLMSDLDLDNYKLNWFQRNGKLILTSLAGITLAVGLFGYYNIKQWNEQKNIKHTIETNLRDFSSTYYNYMIQKEALDYATEFSTNDLQKQRNITETKYLELDTIHRSLVDNFRSFPEFRNFYSKNKEFGRNVSQFDYGWACVNIDFALDTYLKSDLVDNNPLANPVNNHTTELTSLGRDIKDCPGFIQEKFEDFTVAEAINWSAYDNLSSSTPRNSDSGEIETEPKPNSQDVLNFFEKKTQLEDTISGLKTACSWDNFYDLWRSAKMNDQNNQSLITCANAVNSVYEHDPNYVNAYDLITNVNFFNSTIKELRSLTGDVAANDRSIKSINAVANSLEAQQANRRSEYAQTFASEESAERRAKGKQLEADIKARKLRCPAEKMQEYYTNLVDGIQDNGATTCANHLSSIPYFTSLGITGEEVITTKIFYQDLIERLDAFELTYPESNADVYASEFETVQTRASYNHKIPSDIRKATVGETQVIVSDYSTTSADPTTSADSTGIISETSTFAFMDESAGMYNDSNVDSIKIDLNKYNNNKTVRDESIVITPQNSRTNSQSVSSECLSQLQFKKDRKLDSGENLQELYGIYYDSNPACPK